MERVMEAQRTAKIVSEWQHVLLKCLYWSSRLQFRWAKNQQAREKRAEVRGQLRSISSFCAKADLVFDWWCLSFQGMREMDEKKKNKRRMEDDDEESQAIKMPSRKMKFAGLSKKKKRRNWSKNKCFHDYRTAQLKLYLRQEFMLPQSDLHQRFLFYEFLKDLFPWQSSSCIKRLERRERLNESITS